MLNDLFRRIADSAAPKGVLDRWVQRAAALAEPGYYVAARINRLLHESGLARRTELAAVTLSVGNITMGGTGKSPFCIWLVEWLAKENRRAAILTRGYGRADEAKLVVVHDGRAPKAKVRDAGDEPVMLARALGTTPIVACANRGAAGRFALKKFGVDTLVLDDGFQHHDVARHGDIVLVDSTVPLSTLRLTPRGTLREPPGTLVRAHLIVLTRWGQSPEGPRVLREVRRAAPSVPVVRAQVAIDEVRLLESGAALPMESLKGRSAYVLCGVGNPKSVRTSAAGLGLRVLGARYLPDHAPMTREVLLRADSARRRLGADYLVVTEKDAVKLSELGSLPKETVMLRARLRMVSAKDEAIAARTLRACIEARRVRGLLR